MNLKDQRNLILGATQAVATYWGAQASAATDPDVAQFCRDQETGAQRSVERMTAIIGTTPDAPAAPPLPPPA